MTEGYRKCVPSRQNFDGKRSLSHKIDSVKSFNGNALDGEADACLFKSQNARGQIDRIETIEFATPLRVENGERFPFQTRHFREK